MARPSLPSIRSLFGVTPDDPLDRISPTAVRPPTSLPFSQPASPSSLFPQQAGKRPIYQRKRSSSLGSPQRPNFFSHPPPSTSAGIVAGGAGWRRTDSRTPTSKVTFMETDEEHDRRGLHTSSSLPSLNFPNDSSAYTYAHGTSSTSATHDASLSPAGMFSHHVPPEHNAPEREDLLRPHTASAADSYSRGVTFDHDLTPTYQARTSSNSPSASDWHRYVSGGSPSSSAAASRAKSVNLPPLNLPARATLEDGDVPFDPTPMARDSKGSSNSFALSDGIRAGYYEVPPSLEGGVIGGADVKRRHSSALTAMRKGLHHRRRINADDIGVDDTSAQGPLPDEPVHATHSTTTATARAQRPSFPSASAHSIRAQMGAVSLLTLTRSAAQSADARRRSVQSQASTLGTPPDLGGNDLGSSWSSMDDGRSGGTAFTSPELEEESDKVGVRSRRGSSTRSRRGSMAEGGPAVEWTNQHRNADSSFHARRASIDSNASTSSQPRYAPYPTIPSSGRHRGSISQSHSRRGSQSNDHALDKDDNGMDVDQTTVDNVPENDVNTAAFSGMRISAPPSSYAIAAMTSVDATSDGSSLGLRGVIVDKVSEPMAGLEALASAADTVRAMEARAVGREESGRAGKGRVMTVDAGRTGATDFTSDRDTHANAAGPSEFNELPPKGALDHRGRTHYAFQDHQLPAFSTQYHHGFPSTEQGRPRSWSISGAEPYPVSTAHSQPPPWPPHDLAAPTVDAHRRASLPFPVPAVPAFVTSPDPMFSAQQPQRSASLLPTSLSAQTQVVVHLPAGAPFPVSGGSVAIAGPSGLPVVVPVAVAAAAQAGDVKAMNDAGVLPVPVAVAQVGVSPRSNQGGRPLNAAPADGEQPQAQAQAQAQSQAQGGNEGSGAGALRYPCSYCPRRFSRPSSLRIHVFSHTGEKPFQCNICGRGFSVQSNLRRHNRVHRGKDGEKQEDDAARSSTSKRSRTSIPNTSTSSLASLNSEGGSIGSLDEVGEDEWSEGEQGEEAAVGHSRSSVKAATR